MLALAHGGAKSRGYIRVDVAGHILDEHSSAGAAQRVGQGAHSDPPVSEGEKLAGVVENAIIPHQCGGLTNTEPDDLERQIDQPAGNSCRPFQFGSRVDAGRVRRD